ncbi:hypothetical protein [Nocardiopsis sp. CC223A]|uniref:hypothetical protein n=1 Tax=Nocardiopsis sp. CC223A TaxID=3044051 RepID=UPI00278C4947|nr:hypothetical protein [Nocardiopsis sp. CC223A]
MNDRTRCFEPPDLAAGLPAGAVAEIERPATELTALGADADQADRPHDRSGGLREFPLGDDMGFFKFIVARHLREIVIVQVALWPIV